jgi:hypothetical protein
LGLLLEEMRGEIAAAWKQAVARELGGGEPALAFAVAPLLREMGLALGTAEPLRSREAWTRCAVLVRSTALPAQLAREFKLLHRCAWEALRGRGALVSPTERRALDEWLDEALAHALDRLERVRLRAAAYAQPAPVVIPARVIPARAAPARVPPARVTPRTPPPLPRRAARPPPLPRRRASEDEILEVEPVEVGHP